MRSFFLAALLLAVIAPRADAQLQLLAVIDSVTTGFARLNLQPELEQVPGGDLSDFDGDGVPELVFTAGTGSSPFLTSIVVIDMASPGVPAWTYSPTQAELCPTCPAGDRFEVFFDGFIACAGERLLVLNWLWEDYALPESKTGTVLVSTALSSIVQEFPDASTEALNDLTGDGVRELILDYHTGDPDDPLFAVWGNCGGAAAVPMGSVDDGGLRLLPVAPNPATDVTRVSLEVGVGQDVRLEVFDLAGRRIRILHEGRLAAGDHGFVWDHRDEARRAVGPGTYFLRATHPDGVRSQRIVVLN